MSIFGQYLTQTIIAATAEAHAAGTDTVEAHHLLLAIARDGSSAALAAAGLDHATVRAALDREFTHSLAAAGVRVEGGLPWATPGRARSPQLGATARAALERGLAAAPRKRDRRPAHVLLGVVLTQVGTVPRALDLAGIDRAALTDGVRRELADAS
jgi:ATP-dependent Clp protease ATP-binding subunit ClpA